MYMVYDVFTFLAYCWQVFVRFAQEQDLENVMPAAMRERIVNDEVLNPVASSNDNV